MEVDLVVLTVSTILVFLIGMSFWTAAWFSLGMRYAVEMEYSESRRDEKTVKRDPG